MKKIFVLIFSFILFLVNANALSLDMSNVNCNSSADSYLNRIKFIDADGNEKNLVCSVFDGGGNNYKYGDDNSIIFYDTPDEAGYGGKIVLNNFNGQGIIIEKNSGVLLIEVNGTNVINVTKNSGIFSEINMAINGSGTLTINTDSNESTNAIEANDGINIMTTNPLDINVLVGCNANSVQNNGIKVKGALDNSSIINVNLNKNGETCDEGTTRNDGFAIYGESVDKSSDYDFYSGINFTSGTLNVKTISNGIYWKGLNIYNDIILDSDSNIDIDYEVVDKKVDSVLFNLENVILKSFGKIIISPKTSVDTVIDSSLNNPIIIKNSNLTMTNFAVQANTPNSLISYSSDEGNNLILGPVDSTDETNYEYEFNNINSTGKLFTLTNAYLEPNRLASSDSKIKIAPYSTLSSEDFKDVNKIKLVNGVVVISNSEFNTSLGSDYYIHNGYKLVLDEIEDSNLDKLKQVNEEIITSRTVLLTKPDGLEEDEFNLPEDNTFSLAVAILENDRNKDDIVGRVYQLNDGEFKEINASFYAATQTVNSVKQIRNNFTLTNTHMSEGIYLTISDNNKVTTLTDTKTGVTITTPSAVDKTFSVEVNKDFDSIWDKVQESILPSTLKDIYQFEISSPDENATIPEGDYIVSLPLPEMDEDDTLIIYEIKDGEKTEREISYQINGENVEFKVTKDDLINKTIFALGVFEGSKKFVDGDYTLTTESPIYENCIFKALEKEIYASDKNAIKPIMFSLECGEVYPKPDINYTISMTKPDTKDGNVSLYLNDTSVELTQINENDSTRISFKLNKDNFGVSEYNLIYKKLCASVSQNTFTINFNSAGGSSVASIIVDLTKESDTLPIPTKDGYNFLGWYYSNGEKVVASKASEVKHSDIIIEDEYGCPTSSYETVNLVAEWEEKQIICDNAKKSFTLIYNTNGGNELAKEVVTEENTETLNTPTKSGYNFEGWYYDEALTNRISSNLKKNELTVAEIKDDNGCITSYSDLTIYAKWTEITCPELNDNTFEIIFNENNGEEIPNQKITVQNASSKISVPTPKRSGYIFDGWYYQNGNKLTIDDLNNIDKSEVKDSNNCVTSYNDITLEAKWIKETSCATPKEIITIKYETNGGTKLDDNKYGSVILYNELGTTKKDGYTFDGWFYDEKLTNKVTNENWKENIAKVNLTNEIDNETGCQKDKTGTLTLYAKWNIDVSKDSHSVISKDGEIIYNELLDNNNDYELIVDKSSKNEDSFIKGLIENANKSVSPKVIIDIYKFNLESDSTEELPGGKYQIKIPIDDNIKKYDGLEIVELDSLGNKTDREIKLTKDGNYLIFEINKEDLGKTHFALIGNLIEQVPTGTIFKTGVFILLLGGLSIVGYQIKKRRKVYSI